LTALSAIYDPAFERWARLTRLRQALQARPCPARLGFAFFVRPRWSKTMTREELKWQNIDADDLPAAVKKSFDAMVEAEAAFKADLEKLLKNEGLMPEDKFLVMSRKGNVLGSRM
jgi:hypothetical protein